MLEVGYLVLGFISWVGLAYWLGEITVKDLFILPFVVLGWPLFLALFLLLGLIDWEAPVLWRRKD